MYWIFGSPLQLFSSKLSETPTSFID